MGILTFKSYWIQQFNQIKTQGIKAIWRKLKTVSRRLIIFLFTLLVFPIVLVIRVIKPWCWIRFGWFLGSRIGHFAFDVEYYLSERKVGLHPEKAIDVFFYRAGKPANAFFAKMTERYLSVYNWIEPLLIANNWIPGGDQHRILPAYDNYDSRDKNGLLKRVEPQLSFSKEENKMAHSFLKSIGIGQQKFVCMIIRDSAYLKNADYHNYRDVDISIFKEAALALAEKGYWVFRMGKVVHEPFKSDHPRILDYANSEYRSDFLDIWLMANCFFCISTGTGLDEVARIFRRPAVYVNNIPLHQLVTYDHVITVPKHLVWKEINKQLTLSEHLAYPYLHTDQYDNEKILVVDLTPKDIKQAVLEIEARLNGTWKDSEEDQRLQDRFWKIFNSHQDFHKNHGEIHPEARIGADFLRNNPEWLN
jgi:putative glycosyltransferase (TIGR04372 family)